MILPNDRLCFRRLVLTAKCFEGCRRFLRTPADGRCRHFSACQDNEIELDPPFSILGRVRIGIVVIERVGVMTRCELFAYIFGQVKLISVGVMAEAFVDVADDLAIGALEVNRYLLDRIAFAVKISENVTALNGQRAMCH